VIFFRNISDLLSLDNDDDRPTNFVKHFFLMKFRSQYFSGKTNGLTSFTIHLTKIDVPSSYLRI
jgi:hypothetical protein